MRIYEAFLSTAKTIPFVLVSSVDHYTPIAGRSCSVTIRKPGGSWGAATGTVTEIANGSYYWSAASGDLDTLGYTLVKIAATGADDLYLQVHVMPVNVAADVQSMATDVITAAALKADAVTEIQSGLSTLTAQQVWEYGTRTLSSFGSLVSDIASAVWGAATRTLSSFGTLAADVWAVTVRTITGGALDSAYDPAKTAAQAGDKMDLVDSPNATAVSAIQSGLSVLEAQDVRDAMLLAPSAGTPADGSVDRALDDIETLIRGRVVIDWDDWFPTSISDWLPFRIEYDSYDLTPTAIMLTGAHTGEEWDASFHKPAAGTTYYVGYTGASDSNNGLTTATSFASIAKAVSMADVGTVYVYPKFYDRNKGRVMVNGKSLSIIADGGEVRIGHEDTLTWTLAAGANYTYKATRSSAVQVWDGANLDGNGDFTRLTKVLSYGGGDLNAGEWYTDGTYVYCRTTDSRNLVGDANIHVYLAVDSYVTGESTVYLEGITFEGGSYPLRVYNSSASAVPTVYAKNCTFAYGNSVNGLSALGGHTFAQNCLAKCNAADGFNYHAQNGVLCHSVEIDCISRNNGWNGEHINNATSTHDGCYAVRLRGLYHDSDNWVVGDAGSGTTSWNVKCVAYAPNYAGSASYLSQCSGTGCMWLIGCESQEVTEKDLVVSSNGNVRYYGLVGFDSVTVNSGCTYVEVPPHQTTITDNSTVIGAINEIKGSGWTDETLVAIADAIDGLPAPLNAEETAAAVDASETGQTVAENLDAKVSGAGSALTSQQIRDAMKLAPSAGTPTAGSIDAHLDVLIGGDGEIEWVHTVTVDGKAYEGAKVEYYSDSSYSDLAAVGITDSLGQVTFNLAPGTYYVKVLVPGQEVATDVEVVA